MDVGANALLRHVGLAAGGGRGREQAEHVLATSEEAVAANARALGRGIAALVNAHDPEAVTLSGHGVELYERAGDTLMAACEPGLMAIRREHPPRIEGSALGWRGSLLGAMESVFDAFLTPEGLDRWRANHSDQARDTPDRRNVMNSTLPGESPP
jgi:predicted NBD/HSP70 family sugar kinase